MIIPDPYIFYLLLKKRKELGYIKYANYIEKNLRINWKVIIVESGVFSHLLHSNN